jgi:hypothetical protein
MEESLKPENYLKTDLEIVTVNDLDGEIKPEPQERNFLREKTFNSELGSLVNKIFNNEKMSEEPEEMYKEYDSIEKNSLLLQCEKLIYKLKHEEELNTISSNYNPFDTDINVYDDIDDTADYIKAGLLQCGFSKYQILKYNFYDKAYRSDINFLDQSYSSDMYFNINDPVISHINEHDEGFVIKSELINSDPFFSKKFINSDVDNPVPKTYYIIKTSALFHDSDTFKTFGSRVNRFEEFLSPLLLIEIGNKNRIKSGEIFNLLKETAALPLMIYFLKNRIKFSIKNYSYEDTLLMIELFIKSAIKSKFKSYTITLKDYSDKANLFILKFFLSSIRKILKRNSLILRVSINKVVLITTAAEIGDIYNIIDRVNSDAEMIEMQPIDYEDYLNSKEFVNLFL